jgi:hypothetical protein
MKIGKMFFSEIDVNIAFNNFLNTFLRIFYPCFPMKIQYPYKQKSWLISAIRISCANKRKDYLAYRNSNDPNVKEYFKKYCRILARVITTAKKYYYNKLLLKSNNKTRTTWNIVKTISDNKGPTDNITAMKLNDKLSCNLLAIADAFNNYFSSVAEKLLLRNYFGEPSVINKDFLSYLHQNFYHSFPKMKLSNTNAYEIEKIIFSMKLKNSHGYDEIF